MFKQLSTSPVETFEVTLNGQKIQVSQGMTVAAVALTQGLRYTRTMPISNNKRMPFCMMGVCYDCLMVIDGKANQRACMTYVKRGMQIDIQQGVGSSLGETQ